MLTFLELKRLKQEDQEFEVNLNYTVSKKKKKERKFLIDREGGMETWGRFTEKIKT